MYPLFYVIVEFPNEVKHFFVEESDGLLRACDADFIVKRPGGRYFRYRTRLEPE
jgi:hypothetical protein